MILRPSCSFLPAVIVAVLLSAGIPNRSPGMEPKLDDAIAEAAAAAKKLPAERRKLLDPLAASLANDLKARKRAAAIFVCTHNSRRSQFAQIWAQTAAVHYGVQGLTFASGGTETTAANIRTVNALRRAGFDVKATTEGKNPRYVVSLAKKKPTFEMFSKVYSDRANPQKQFVAVMCCSDADENCPVVMGASDRFPLHYVDPKAADGTDKEAAAYDERCRQIAAEMFYVLSQVKDAAAGKRNGDKR